MTTTDLLETLVDSSDPLAELRCAPPALVIELMKLHTPTGLARMVGDAGQARRYQDLAKTLSGYEPYIVVPPSSDGAKLQAFRAQNRRLQAENDRLGDWRALVAQTISSAGLLFEPVPPASIAVDRRRGGEHVLLACISDVHIGEQVKLAETGGVAQYDFETFKCRLGVYKAKLAAIARDMGEIYPIRTLVLQCLGDIATSEGVFPKQLARLDLHLHDQIMESAFHMADLCRWAATIFPRVKVFCVPGNHTPKDLTLNTDSLIYTIMQSILSQQENVDVHVAASHFLGYRLGPDDGFCDFGESTRSWNILLTHGHQAKRYMSVPYYALNRLIRNYTDMTETFWHRMYCGHSHEDTKGTRWQVNGCWPGGTEYSTEKMQGASRPSQHVDLFSPQHGIISHMELWLDGQPALGEPVDGVYTPTLAARSFSATGAAE